MRSYHATLTLSNSVVKPTDTRLSLKDLAVIACMQYLDATQEQVEQHKSLISLERRTTGNVKKLSVLMDGITDELYASLKNRRFTATFISYSLTRLIEYVNSLPQDSQCIYLRQLEEAYYAKKAAEYQPVTKPDIPQTAYYQPQYQAAYPNNPYTDNPYGVATYQQQPQQSQYQPPLQYSQQPEKQQFRKRNVGN